MRRSVLFAVSVLFVFVGMMPLDAQDEPAGNTAVLFGGASLRGPFRPLSDDAGLSGMRSTRSIFPGGEIRLNQNRRITYGAEYQQLNLAGPAESYSVIEHPQTGKGMAVINLNSRATARLLGGRVYFNLPSFARVFRPFIGAGGGMAFIKKNYSMTSFVDPDFEKVFGYKFNFERPTDSYDVNMRKPFVSGLVGTNVSLGPHLLASFSGGWENGGIFKFQFGPRW